MTISALKLVLFLLFTVIVSAIVPNNINAQSVIYESDFENQLQGSTPTGWTIQRNYQWANQSAPCMNSSSPAEWLIYSIEETNKAGIILNGEPCVTEITPDNISIPDTSNYTYEVDMTIGDHVNRHRNIAFRYNLPWQWYGLKITGTNNVEVQKVVNASFNHLGSFSVPYTFQPNTKYNFKFNIVNNNIDIFIDNTLMHSVQDQAPILEEGTIALQASIGEPGINQTYFDNIKVTDLSSPPTPGFEVPYYSQLDYDTVTYDSTENTIAELGCALTSAAMILRHHELFLLPDLYVLNPSTLNTYLTENDGYGLGGGILFNEISRMTYLMSEDSGAFNFDALDYHKQIPVDYSFLDETLSQSLNPAILETVDSISPSGVHFVVARGVVDTESEYVINDPLDQDKDILITSSHPIHSVRYFEPTNTNLSAIVVQANQQLDLTVTDPFDNVTNRETSLIPNASLLLELPIINDVDPTQTGGEPIWEFFAEDPQNGTYFIEALTDSPSGFYELWIIAYNLDGTRDMYKQTIFLGQNTPRVFQLNYNSNQNNPSNLITLATYESLESLTDDIFQQGWITNNSAYQTLQKHLQVAQKVYIKDPGAGQVLFQTIVTLIDNFYKQGKIIDPGYTLLKTELNNFIASL